MTRVTVAGKTVLYSSSFLAKIEETAEYDSLSLQEVGAFSVHFALKSAPQPDVTLDYTVTDELLVVVINGAQNIQSFAVPEPIMIGDTSGKNVYLDISTYLTGERYATSFAILVDR